MSSGGWGGVISTAYKKFDLRCINSYRYIFPEYVAALIHDLRDADMDISVLCAGDNGSGKSVAAAIIFKCVNPETPFGPEHVVYAEDKHSDFMSKMEALNDSVLVIDELNKFMSHRSFQDKSQNNLIHFIEIARAKRVATISCVNSYFKVDKSFREGKISIVIQMMDRKKSDSDGLGRSCAAVFAAPPIMLSSSRFGLDALADCHSDQEFINLAPWLPSFRGFMFFPDKFEEYEDENGNKKRRYLTDDEWSAYTEAKMRGIRKSFEMAKAQTLNAEKRNFKDVEEKSEEEVAAEATALEHLPDSKGHSLQKKGGVPTVGTKTGHAKGSKATGHVSTEIDAKGSPVADSKGLSLTSKNNKVNAPGYKAGDFFK